MLETYLAPIDYKADLSPSSSSSLRRAFQQRASYRLVEGPDPYGGVVQQAAQAPGGRRKGGFVRILLAIFKSFRQ